MSELSLEDKCKLAAGLVEQTPPGEINDVVNDIRAIIADDQSLMTYVLSALRSYNLAQLQVVEHTASEGVPAHTSIISNATVLPGTSGEGERFVDAEGKRSFAFDHVNLIASDYHAYELPEEEESFRSALAKSLAAYAKNHFPSGHSSVSTSQFPLLPPASQPAPVTAQEPTATQTSENAVEAATPLDASEPTEEVPVGPVTDVVDEQVNAGDVEPAATPVVGDAPVEKDEIVRPESLDQLDELVEEAKEEEESGEKVEKVEKPEVDEVAPAAIDSTEQENASTQNTEVVAQPVAEEPQVEERKQERVENPTYTLEVVGNKYNTNNFWTGRWRTRWVVDKASGTVDGTINVDVHYYEQGNVQLATTHTASFPCPTEDKGSQSVASQIVTTISKVETAYQLELNDVYGELGDKAFRALRRALPVTRQKMDWEKVSGYSLGSDLTKARG
ncbi:hypothetical protein IAU60_002411 [Kwoniella sp. DSM 27419]